MSVNNGKITPPYPSMMLSRCWEYLKDSGNVFVAYVLTEKADTLRPSDYPTWGS